MPRVTPTSYAVGVREGTSVTSEQTQDVEEPTRHEERRVNGDRVIVVNSQPQAGQQGLPPRKLRSLGPVASHATETMPGEGRPRRSSGRGGNAFVALVLMAVPVAAAAWGITFLEERTEILAATGALAVLWLLGIVAAWRGLAPGGRDKRAGVWLGRAIGLVLGALAAIYLLLDTVTPLF